MNTIAENDIWDAYNLLLLSQDVERLRKILARYELFRKTLDLPGDIVECGVFKGSGLMLFMKFLHIFAPGSARRVIGFDMFDHFPVTDAQDAAAVADYVAESNFKGITTESLYQKIEAAGFSRERCDLVAGDIGETAAAYVNQHPGFRISLLHLDLDLEKPTFAALEALWDRVVRGGVVVFDEYAINRWSESQAVDRFFKNADIQLLSLPWSRTPTAYLVKP